MTSHVNAQNGPYPVQLQQMDDLVIGFMSRWKIPGGSAAISRNGQVIYSRGFGFSDVARSRYTQADDLFRIASVTKPITSIAIMKLIEDGSLSLGDTVFGPDKILDDLYYLGQISDDRIFTITVRHLLEHTAGWDRTKKYAGFGHSDPLFFPLHVAEITGEKHPAGDSTSIRFMLQRGLNHDPGTTYAYSNIGYLILGKVIEKITGVPYHSYVQEHILNPLGITDILPARNLPAHKPQREVDYLSTETELSCYGTGHEVPLPYGGFNIEAMNANGGWIASAGALTQLLLAIDGFTTVPDILSPETIRIMTEPGQINTKYAKGWSVNTKSNWWHTGSLEGSAAFVCRTGQGYTFVFLFNSRADNSKSFWSALDKLPWTFLNSVPFSPTPIVSAATSLTDPQAATTQQNGARINNPFEDVMKQRDYATDHFFQNFQNDMNGDTGTSGVDPGSLSKEGIRTGIGTCTLVAELNLRGRRKIVLARK